MSKFWISTPELMAMEIPPLRWIVEDIIPEGLTILVGRQKLGKSQLALNLAVAVEIGGSFLGHRVPSPGAVLYLDLELGQRRVRKRLDNMFPSAAQRPNLSHLDWVMPNGAIAFPPLGKDFYARLDEWRETSRNPRLIVVDIIANVMPAPAKGLTLYQAENKMLAPLRDYANRHGIAIVIVHHTKQGLRDDPLEKASGSNAMTSVPNHILVFDGRVDEPIATLYMRGHDAPERKLAIRKDNMGWFENLGDARMVFAKASRRKIIEAILTNGGPMTRAEIHDATEISVETVKKTVQRMLTDKPPQLAKVGDKLDVPGREKVSPVSPSMDEDNKPLQNKDNSIDETGTVEVSPKDKEMSPVPAETDIEPGEADQAEPLSHSETSPKDFRQDDNTPSQQETGDNSSIEGTVTSKEGVPEEAIEKQVNLPVRGQGDTLSDDELYLLNWLIGFDGEPSHRNAQQRCSPRLDGDTIKVIAKRLSIRGLLDIEAEGTGKRKKQFYYVTDEGKAAYREATCNPNQADIFDLLST